MARKLHVGHATAAGASLTGEDDYDVVSIERLGPSPDGKRKPLTDAEWQKVVDVINEAFKAKEI